MDLPVMPPVKPMLAKSVKTIPPGMQYEAKWDGFRAIVHRDGDELVIGSRTGKPLTRYFPELVADLLDALPDRCVVDGEIVIAHEGRLDFDRLTERIHPADSRVRMLAEQTPASFVAFDLLAIGDEALLDAPLSLRRTTLAAALAEAEAPVHLAPATTDAALAQEWFERYEGAGLDGIIAKPLDLPYRPDARLMFKIKHERTADAVVAGYRLHKSGPVVGSLLLGLYDDSGALQHVGVCAAFSMKRREELIGELEPLRMDPPDGHPWAAWAQESAHEGARLPGAQSRWSGKKDLSWVALRPERVIEVAYDHMEGDRFRHTAQFRRWRPDRDPGDCTYAQLEEPVGYDLSEVLSPPGE
ncbi:ATP-dependent DNA ligase [Streptomyces lunaelactis]|uniref:ATP-dependent DNA ligase n=1 Tax=Streptomyces lunaelactis TaxID=1535768 RepID=UPI001584B9DF|nr:ATP-dependent DNA ligase [Streptomyces lunaelactis]NUK03828.1 ATP-dependent DNA ligase [Streptomyces lunaelactis]NUK17397.1 ATP-dependent DNA ligase [Streptomyces lunaelactis]NUK36655.1 ATP-dependent DNA ligase [Streptomyces lunaelactis]NUK43868.1 ATP-dependent DNA ligase [Streptomyces lunaelactis]NUK52740.1 ATP-dependent DNA ligase [Streptomyces lunaelactis]